MARLTVQQGSCRSTAADGSGATATGGAQEQGGASRGAQGGAEGQGLPTNCDPSRARVGTAGTTRLSAVIADGTKKPGSRLSPAERLRRTELVLDHFGVPPAESVDLLLADLTDLQTVQGLESRLAKLDSEGELKRYVEIAKRDGHPVLRVFKDPDTKKVLDREILLRDGRAGDTPAAFHARLLAAHNNPAGHELKGLRISIDPGHMGGDTWGKRTGKYIEHEGRVLYEGDLTLEVAKLLAEKLRARGAEVTLTRTDETPVTKESWDGFDIQRWGREELRASVTQPWFQRMLSEAKNDGDLIARAERHPDIKRLFSAKRKGTYYALRSDVRARAKKIAEHRPDITLVLHFDAVPAGKHGHGIKSKAPELTKSYVPGTFLKGELATPEDRAQALRHLLEPNAFGASVNLSRAIVDKLNHDLGLKAQTRHGPGGKAVADGVFTRNLRLTRQVQDSALAYLELLFYNHPHEFEALARRGPGGAVPRRIESIVRSIEGGVVGFVAEYRDDAQHPKTDEGP